MERRDRPSIATFFADATFIAASALSLSGGSAQHARVRRIEVGASIRLTNGAGQLASAQVVRIDKDAFHVEISDVVDVPAPPHARVFAPVADRDRTLWLAEKVAELRVTVWQPVVFRRSLSVSSRGEGDAFRNKLKARMISAIEQSAGAWLPEIRGEQLLDALLAESAGGARDRYLLDRGGVPLLAQRPGRAADIMIGPEGGLEAAERDAICASGWTPVSLGDSTLRFETAGVVAVGIIRALLDGAPER